MLKLRMGIKLGKVKGILNQFLKLLETENPSPKTIDKSLNCNIILIDYFKLKRR